MPKTTRVMLLVTEDWFVLSHFKPLLRGLVAACADVLVVTTSSGRLAEIEAMGVRTVALDYDRTSRRAGRQLYMIRKIRELVRQHAPTVVHAVALQPIALAGLALRSLPAAHRPRFVMHPTGTGPAGPIATAGMPLSYAMTLAFVKFLLRAPGTALLVENPDDAARIAGPDWAAQRRVLIVGGAGVDPAEFPVSQRQPTKPVVVGYLGRMLWTKGVGQLVEAHQLLRARGVEVDLVLAGGPDPANRWSIPQATIDVWSRLPGITCCGPVEDVAAFWRQADIAVIPSNWGEGLPRVLLEAAASARPLVATDVPGIRYFVRHDRDGWLVPPGDPEALAAAIAWIAADPQLMLRLGERARARLLEAFTDRHVTDAIVTDYNRIIRS